MSIVTKLPDVLAQSRAFISGRDHLPLMKALDWAETSGNFVTIDICPSIYLASEVLNPKSCLHLATQRFSKHMYVRM